MTYYVYKVGPAWWAKVIMCERGEYFAGAAITEYAGMLLETEDYEEAKRLQQLNQGLVHTSTYDPRRVYSDGLLPDEVPQGAEIKNGTNIDKWEGRLVSDHPPLS